tara:strand:+ start:361 stop:651 length:291 start_codon:yes stop_codon:yes gene_type:complete
VQIPQLVQDQLLPNQAEMVVVERQVQLMPHRQQELVVVEEELIITCQLMPKELVEQVEEALVEQVEEHPLSLEVMELLTLVVVVAVEYVAEQVDQE